MSIYGPRIRLPQINIPEIPIKVPEIGLKTIIGILLIILIISTILFFVMNPIQLNQHITTQWKNNPLNLEKNLENYSELKIILLNDTKETQDLTLIVQTESNELMIDCPDKEFPRVAPNHKRETICTIIKNPFEKIFTGTYQIKINTNLGETTTTLEVRR